MTVHTIFLSSGTQQTRERPHTYRASYRFPSRFNAGPPSATERTWSDIHWL